MRPPPLPTPRLLPWIAAGVLAVSPAAAEDGPARPESAEQALPEANVARLDRPIWLLGLDDPRWLFAHRGAADGAEVAVFAFANLVAEDRGADDLGADGREPAGWPEEAIRATRSLPLFLAERVFVETDCEASAQVVVVPGLGSVVSATPWPFEAMLASAGDDPPDAFVTGAVGRRPGGGSRVSVEIWDVRTGRRAHVFEEASYFEAPSAGALSLARALVSRLVDTARCRRVAPPSGWEAPPEALVGAHLDALGRLVPQVLASAELVPRDGIRGEEDALAGYRALRDRAPGSLAARLIFLRGVLLSHDTGGKAHVTHAANLTAELAASERTDDPIHRLSPLAFARLGRVGECSARRAELLPVSEGAYRRWLVGVDCGATAAP